jgi:hypothetical protein
MSIQISTMVGGCRYELLLAECQVLLWDEDSLCCIVISQLCLLGRRSTPSTHESYLIVHNNPCTGTGAACCAKELISQQAQKIHIMLSE